MPDESFKTYQEVMDYLKSKKNRKINLLFGNGFSMGYDPQIFSYNALSEFVKKCKDATILKLFRIVGSTNFELIMRSLDLFVEFGEEFAPAANLKEVIIPAKEKLKGNLLEAITGLHPEHVFKVPEEKSRLCALFLKDFLDSKGSIFSTNYDLLLYWILMRESAIFGDNMRDGFSRGEDPELTWSSGTQNIYYLHGSLPLFDCSGTVIKEEYDDQNFLLGNIKKRIDNDQYPIFVTAGTAQEKMEMISHNRYLSYCYESLSNLNGSLVVIGFNFGKYDSHIIDAINQAAQKRKGHSGCLCSIFIGYYTEEDRKHLIEISPQFKIPQEKIRIFDVKTANIWNRKIEKK